MTVEILAPAVITPDRSTVVTGDTVNLTLSIPWTTNFVVNSNWQWVKDSANSPNPVVVQGCGHVTTCSYRVFGDGHAVASGIVAEGVIPMTAVGSQIHVAPTHLTLVVDSSHVASGSQVKFTARRGDSKAVQVQSWVWTPGGGSPPGPQAVDCAGGDSLCVTTLQNTTPVDAPAVQTGSMTAWAVLGTASESASVAVTVDPPAVDTSCGGAPMAGRPSSATPRQSRAGVAPRAQLTCGGGGAGDSIHIAIDRDTINGLYPRIRAGTVNGVTVAEREPDTASVQVTVFVGGSPASNVSVTIRAEFLPLAGGHAHHTTPVRFENAPRLPTGPEAGYGLMGYFFAPPDQKHNGVAALTDGNGVVTTKLVAGYIGGRARVIASAGTVGRVHAESVVVAYAVPGLVSLQARVDSAVYWIGGTAEHPQGVNFYVQDSLGWRLDTLANNLRTTVNNAPRYLQFNDASLPSGGTFSVATSSEPLTFEHPFSGGHLSHDTGLDLDVSLCYADAEGDGGNKVHRVQGRIKNGVLTCLASIGGAQLSGYAIDQTFFTDQASLIGAISRIHLPEDSTHFHLRFH